MNLIHLLSFYNNGKILGKITGYQNSHQSLHFHKYKCDLLCFKNLEMTLWHQCLVKIWHSVPNFFNTCLFFVFKGNDPCSPYPCGPNTDCMVSPLGVAVCRCKSGFFPKPDTITGCGPQCDDDDDCSNSQNCANGRCVNICEEGICGVGALCEPRNRRAICRCPSGYSGDPFTRCSPGNTGKIKGFWV